MPLYEGIGIINDKLNVVIDIGAAYTKLGFAGEYSPRCIIPSEVKCKNTGELKKIFDYKNEQELFDILVDFIHKLYFKYALISPKDKSVIIVESLLCPSLFRDTLAKVLFTYYEVSSLLVLASHLISLAPLAIDTALVLDVGYSEAVLIPVCHGVPVIHAWQALPLASQAVHGKIKTSMSAANNRFEIDETTAEDIKVRCCFVTTQQRAEKAMTDPNFKYCPDIKYALGGSKFLNVPGKLRETAFELMFEEDNDHQCISTMILDAILKISVDLRISLAENILIVGGTGMTTGFKARLKSELYKQLDSDLYKGKLKITTFKFHSAPCKENYTAWLGGAIYGCTDLVGMKNYTKESYFKENRLPDWANMLDNNHNLYL